MIDEKFETDLKMKELEMKLRLDEIEEIGLARVFGEVDGRIGSPLTRSFKSPAANVAYDAARLKEGRYKASQPLKKRKTTL